jgi:SWI/SNF-related matrix-associated actin-dependent regulator of chromatin subfamily A-like protein 1
MLTHRRCIFGYAAGSGKTPTTLVALEKAGPWRTLCVAPKSVLSHWAEEAALWFPGLRVVEGWGSATARRAARTEMAGMPDQPTMLLLNYEAVRQDVEELSQITWGALVVDEAHRLKGRSTQITKAVNRLVKHPRMWLWLLTGTPLPNRPQEAWSLLHLIDRHRFSSYWRWVEKHCELEPLYARRGPRTRFAPRIITGLRPGAEAAIREELADVLLYRSLDDLLPDLPEATVTPIFVELDAEERRVYRDLVKRAWSTLEDGTTLRTMNEIGRMTRLRQIVSSMDALGAGREKPGSKVATAVELAADLEPEQVVVLTWSRAAAERVAAETGGEFIHGGVEADERVKIMAGFADGSVRVLSGTISTLGEGVDGMQVAHHLIRLDRSWVPSQNDQAAARIRRSGQLHDSVFIWDLIARNSIDEVIEKALAAKESVIDALLVAPMTMET